MECQLKITFRDMPELAILRRHLVKEVERLDQKFEGIESCEVAVGLPYNHRYPGNLYDLEIAVVTPGKHFNAFRGPSVDGSSSDVLRAIRGAFHEIERALEASVFAKDLPPLPEMHLCRRTSSPGHFYVSSN